MGIIECAENCKFQKDGYCSLETLSKVNSSSGGCPHYISASFDKVGGLLQTADSD